MLCAGSYGPLLANWSDRYFQDYDGEYVNNLWLRYLPDAAALPWNTLLIIKYISFDFICITVYFIVSIALFVGDIYFLINYEHIFYLKFFLNFLPSKYSKWANGLLDLISHVIWLDKTTTPWWREEVLAHIIFVCATIFPMDY